MVQADRWLFRLQADQSPWARGPVSTSACSESVTQSKSPEMEQVTAMLRTGSSGMVFLSSAWPISERCPDGDISPSPWAMLK